MDDSIYEFRLDLVCLSREMFLRGQISCRRDLSTAEGGAAPCMLTLEKAGRPYYPTGILPVGMVGSRFIVDAKALAVLLPLLPLCLSHSFIPDHLLQQTQSIRRNVFCR